MPVVSVLMVIWWHFRILFCGPMRDALPWTEENGFDIDSVSWGPFFSDYGENLYVSSAT